MVQPGSKTIKHSSSGIISALYCYLHNTNRNKVCSFFHFMFSACVALYLSIGLNFLFTFNCLCKLKGKTFWSIGKQEPLLAVTPVSSVVNWGYSLPVSGNAPQVNNRDYYKKQNWLSKYRCIKSPKYEFYEVFCWKMFCDIFWLQILVLLKGESPVSLEEIIYKLLNFNKLSLKVTVECLRPIKSI